jgi:hypothetical protein
MLALLEISQVEHEICSYLKQWLNVKLSALEEFETMAQKDYMNMGTPSGYTLNSFIK